MAASFTIYSAVEIIPQILGEGFDFILVERFCHQHHLSQYQMDLRIETTMNLNSKLEQGWLHWRQAVLHYKKKLKQRSQSETEYHELLQVNINRLCQTNWIGLEDQWADQKRRMIGLINSIL